MLAIGSAVAWALTSVAMRPIAANLVRFPIATLFFAGYVAMARPTEELNGRIAWLTVAAAAGTLGSAMMFLGGITAAGDARGVALNATAPIFSAILAVVLLKERLSRRAAAGIICSVLGTVLLVI